MIKQFIIRILAFINFAEGAIHLLVSAISFWGMYDTQIWDWRIAAAPTTDLFLGVASIITGYVLKEYAICSHHKCDEKSHDKDK
jgi:hypothetical protein